MDQRIENTHNVLQSSMRELLGQTTWDKITVQSLCQCAGVSRTTFYSHFKDKDDLLDSLLEAFEKAMLSDKNGRSLDQTGTFRFLPILANHVNGNRKLFAKSNSTANGYPVARRFKSLIERLVAAEFNEVSGTNKVNLTAQNFIAGGIYNALVQWSRVSNDATHLTLLAELDQIVNKQV